MKKLLTYSILILIYACGQTLDKRKPSGLLPIKEFGKWGYINSDGQTVIKCQFNAARNFSEGRAAILVDTLWGFIDTTGKIVIQPKFIEVEQYSDGLCFVTLKKDTILQNSFIKKNGDIAFTTTYEVMSNFNSGRCEVRINNKISFINKKGEIVLNTHLESSAVSEYSEGIAKLIEGEGYWKEEGLSKVWTGYTGIYIDTSGKVITRIKDDGGYNYFSEGYAFVSINDTFVCIDKRGKIKFKSKNKEHTYSNFSDGLAKVFIPGGDHKAGFVDTTGKIVIPIQYHDIRDFKEGLAAFRDKDGWGFIDKRGKVVIKPQYEQIEYDGFSNGLCRAKQNHQWGYINYKGEFVWKEQIGLEYTKIDLVKWELDTLEISNPLYADKYAGSDNFPRKQTFATLNELTLKVDTADLTVFADKYYAYKLYLINASKDPVKIPAQSGRIKIIQQAKNKNGEWQDIDNFINSFCGNSYHTLRLAPNEFQIFATPIFKGEFKTQLRFKLEIDKLTIYSNIYLGQINQGQLLDPKDKDKTGIAVWTN